MRPIKNQCWDKKGYPIRGGDLLKVFHFIGSRNKKHYMYKLVFTYISEDGVHLMANHLCRLPFDNDLFRDSYRLPGGVLDDYEIVQGFANEGDEISFEDRKKIK